jgi:hypothetical protein
MKSGAHHSDATRALIAERARLRWSERGEIYRSKAKHLRAAELALCELGAHIEGTRRIPLLGGLFATIDEQDYPLVSAYAWHALSRKHTTYAIANTWNGQRATQRTIFMHRLILGAKPGESCDHIDCNGLNNIRNNLRLATRSQNGANRRIFKGRKFKGVRRIPGGINARKVWQAVIRVRGQLMSCGLYETPEQAAAAYDHAAVRHFGPFARLNTPSSTV